MSVARNVGRSSAGRNAMSGSADARICAVDVAAPAEIVLDGGSGGGVLFRGVGVSGLTNAVGRASPWDSGSAQRAGRMGAFREFLFILVGGVIGAALGTGFGA